MNDKPTFDTVITESLSTLNFGATITPLPDKFGQDYRALHNWHLEHLAGKVAELPSITDAKTYDQNQRARTHLVSIRTGLDKTRKALFEPMRRLKTEVDEYIGTTPDSGLQARLKALERIIEAKQAEWDAARERERQEALRVLQERSAARWRELEALGFRFDGAAYWIGDLNHPMMLRKPKAEVDAMNDGAWAAFLRTAQHNADEFAKEKQAEDWYNAYLSAGATVDTITGHAAYTLLDGREIAVLHETLHGMAKDAVEAEITLIVEDVAARRRAKDEEHEAMRRRFEEQAERERKADEDRAELDRQRAALKAEKQATRHERLIALGAEWDERGFYHVGGDLCQVVGNLADLKDEDWQMALEAVPRAKEKWDAIQAEKQRVADLVHHRVQCLARHGAEVDEHGTWTLGNATTTSHLLGQMDQEAWEATQAAFDAEKEVIEAQSAQHLTVEETRTSQVDTRELLACALALLDEANKCETIAADDLDDDECEQMCVKVVAHADACVKLIRELQTKRA